MKYKALVLFQKLIINCSFKIDFHFQVQGITSQMEEIMRQASDGPRRASGSNCAQRGRRGDSHSSVTPGPLPPCRLHQAEK